MTSETANGCSCVPTDAGAMADAGVAVMRAAIAAGISTFNTIILLGLCFGVWELEAPDEITFQPT